MFLKIHFKIDSYFLYIINLIFLQRDLHPSLCTPGGSRSSAPLNRLDTLLRRIGMRPNAWLAYS